MQDGLITQGRIFLCDFDEPDRAWFVRYQTDPRYLRLYDLAEWGRFRLAVDASIALVRYGFETLNLKTIIGDTASGNRRVEKLARWFGAEIVARRTGPDWMQARGWQEVDWAITRESWAKSQPHR